jgi:hypothetical protein
MRKKLGEGRPHTWPQLKYKSTTPGKDSRKRCSPGRETDHWPWPISILVRLGIPDTGTFFRLSRLTAICSSISPHQKVTHSPLSIAFALSI